MQKRDNTRHQGFTLVELSIVLVIMGLIVGGIMAGQSVIRNTEAKTIISQTSKIRSAVLNFRTKYAGWPGDLTDATSYWGSAGGTGFNDACFSIFKSGLPTCNGDGNGGIYRSSTATAPGINEWNERFQVWQHLANAGLIEGNYTGRTGSASSFEPLPGTNSPKPAISSAFFDIYMEPVAWVGHPNFFDGPYAVNMLTLYGIPAKGYSAVTPEEAWNIDTKLDDGRPGTGLIINLKRSSVGVGANCTTTDVATTAEYDLTNKAISCVIIYGIESPPLGQ